MDLNRHDPKEFTDVTLNCHHLQKELKTCQKINGIELSSITSVVGKKSLKKGQLNVQRMGITQKLKMYTNKIHLKVCYKKRRQIQISKLICIEYICD